MTGDTIHLKMLSVCYLYNFFLWFWWKYHLLTICQLLSDITWPSLCLHQYSQGSWHPLSCKERTKSNYMYFAKADGTVEKWLGWENLPYSLDAKMGHAGSVLFWNILNCLEDFLDPDRNSTLDISLAWGCPRRLHDFFPDRESLCSWQKSWADKVCNHNCEEWNESSLVNE